MAQWIMRTTVDIPDPLYRRLKGEAASEGRSIREWILHLVKEKLESKPRKGGRVRLPIIRSRRPGSLKLDNAKIFEIVPFP